MFVRYRIRLKKLNEYLLENIYGSLKLFQIFHDFFFYFILNNVSLIAFWLHFKNFPLKTYLCYFKICISEKFILSDKFTTDNNV